MSTSDVADLNRLAASFTYYDCLMFIGVGVPLNLINIVVFIRILLNKTNKTNMGFLGLCQSIIDILVLMYFSLVLRSTAFFGANFSNTNDLLCKLTNYIRRFLSSSSSWMEVITTFDRFIFVTFGHGGRFGFMKKKRYLAIIIASVAFCLAIAHICNLFYYISKGNCTADFPFLVASDMMLICLRSYVPLFLMIFFNLFMIRIVIQKKRAVMNQPSKSMKEYIFTLSVIANDAFFVILDIPYTIYFVFYDTNLYSGAFNNNPLFNAYYNLIGTIAKDLALYVQTLTFFVYLIFNKLYRNEILDLLGKFIPILKKISNVSPSTGNHTNTRQSNTN